jgi:PTS system nitrogen regulatory IIA component
MRILDLLTPARVVVDATATSKKRLLEQLARLLNDGDGDDAERAVYESLVKRERLGSTGLGQGVAIPHGRSAAISRACGCFVRLREPVDFNADDGKSVDLVFALVVPEHFTDQHLMFLAELAGLFSDPATVAELRKARDASALYEALAGWSEQNRAA